MTNTTTEFNVATFGLGQEETPLSPARATFAFGRAVADFAGNRYALAQETRPVAGTPARLRQVEAYERAHKRRRTVIEASERRRAAKSGSGAR